MRILLYGLNFAPEPTGIGKYTGEMAAWLVRAGHEVRAIAAPPYYPEWSIAPGYSATRGRTEAWQGVTVLRTPLWVPRRLSGLKRVLHLASFAFLSLPALVRQLRWQPEIVVVVAPAFACAPGGWALARLCGAQSWLHIQDFEIDAAFRMGMLRGAWLEKVVSAGERWMMRRFDRVSTISGRMMDVLRAKRIENARAVLFPNWVDVGAITPLQRPSAYRAELGIADDAVVALFSGSMSGKQGLEWLVRAAHTLEARHPGVVFVFCGDGVCKPTIERDCAGLANVRLLPLQPVERLNDLLGLADIHLLPQQAEAADLVMPSKLTGMLSSGRPVVATARAGTELANVVAGRGVVVPPEDLSALVDAILRLAEDAPQRRALGHAARHYAESELARDRILAAFDQAMRRCVDLGGAAAALDLDAHDERPRAPARVPLDHPQQP